MKVTFIKRSVYLFFIGSLMLFIACFVLFFYFYKPFDLPSAVERALANRISRGSMMKKSSGGSTIQVKYTKFTIEAECCRLVFVSTYLLVAGFSSSQFS